MTAITSDCTFGDAIPTLARKMIYIKTPATADNTDTIVVDLDKYGIKNVLGHLTFIHSTDLSVMTLETTDACTSVVSGTDLTLTIGGSTANKRRFIVVFGE